MITAMITTFGDGIHMPDPALRICNTLLGGSIWCVTQLRDAQGIGGTLPMGVSVRVFLERVSI